MSDVRHAVARSTGATTYARKSGEGTEWTITCLNHGAEVTVPSRGKAWITGSHPQDFCEPCGAIFKGKADRITGDRLPIPTPKPSAKPVRKRAPRKAAAAA